MVSRAFKTVRVCMKCGREIKEKKKCSYCGGVTVVKAVMKKLN